MEKPAPTLISAERRIEPLAVYAIRDAARLVLMHPDTLRAKLRDGVVQGNRRGGGNWRIKGSELLKLA